MFENTTQETHIDLMRRLVFKKAENALTEYLSVLLGIDILFAAFEKHVLRSGPKIFGKPNIQTQVENKRAIGQPDMRIECSSWLILIENKLGSGLTEYQPEEYVKELQNTISSSTRGALVFIVPKKQIDGGFGDEVWTRLNMSVNKGRFVGECNNVLVVITSWETISLSFSECELSNPVDNYLKESFIHLVSNFAASVSEPMTQREVQMANTQEFIQTSLTLMDLINSVKGRLEETGEITSKSSSETDLSWRGFYAWHPKESERKIWFGSFFRASNRYSQGPLWVQLDGPAFNSEGVRGKIRKSFKIFEGGIFEGWGGWLVSLNLIETLVNEEQINSLLEQIIKIRNACI